MRKSLVTIGLVGQGVVGSGLLKVFEENLPVLEAKVGTRLRVGWVASRRRRTLPVIGGVRPRFTKDWRDVVSDPAVDIVVELIGGLEPARTLILASLKAGKQVATANKAVLAGHWPGIFTTAQSARGLVYFEAAVGGGIPVIQGLNEGLAANRISRIFGILNGTTNYILTRMNEEGLRFNAALKAAQAAGFAEADPSFDIEGVDAAQKLAILASLATGGWVKTDDVSREGLAGLELWDLNFARRRLGLVGKFLALADIDGDKVLARVHTTLIPENHPFATVRHEYNAFVIHGDAVGDVMFYGKGAGAMPTASAVVSDVMYLARQVAGGMAGRMPYTTYDAGRKLKIMDLEDHQMRRYLRFSAADRPGVLAAVTQILSKHEISIASVHQEDGPVALADVVRKSVPIVIVTHEAPEGAVQAALKETRRVRGLARRPVHLRIDPLR
ncbi:MAG TPA: homoserine dehydrogenase [Elusimicrobiota bacterium]|nr:homoserine dehydrogenase [Elusimicrobiota bacterium]